MFNIIMYFLLIVFGSYIDFISWVKWIKALYKFKDCNVNADAHHDHEVVKKIDERKN